MQGFGTISVPNKRNEFLDVCKGIGILCVYYGHTAMGGTLPSRMIFSFHMPLFFMISGALFDVGKIDNFKSLLIKVARNLLIPYCFFEIIGYMARRDVSLLWHRPVHEIVRLLHGTGHAESAWFLMCLTSVQILAWLYLRCVKSYRRCYRIIVTTIFVVSCIGIAHVTCWYIPRNLVRNLPFMLGSVPAAMIFFMLGNSLKDLILSFGKAKVRTWITTSLLLVAICLFALTSRFMRGTFSLVRPLFHISVMPSCIFGIAAVFLLSKISMSISMARIILSLIGERSLYLFALELPLSFVLAQLSHGFLPFPCWSTKHDLYVEPIRIFTILSLAWLCSYPAMWLLGKFRRLSHV